MTYYLRLLCSTLAFVTFASNPEATNPEKKINIVATFSILGDVVKNVGGDRIHVTSIVGPNQDTHVYEPTPQTNKLILKADLIFINGLGFETWFERLIHASGYRGPVVMVSKGIDVHKMIEPKISKEPVPDPHVWNDVKNVMIWVANIKNALQNFDPQYHEFYERNAQAYLKQLQELDQWIKHEFSSVPAKNCKVITAHDAFNYFERAYNLIFLAPSGLSTEDEPSAFEIVELIKLIRNEGIKTIFVENIASTHLIKQIAKETGATIGGTLYSDALSSADEPGNTYIKMMRSNVLTLKNSLSCFDSKATPSHKGHFK